MRVLNHALVVALMSAAGASAFAEAADTQSNRHHLIVTATAYNATKAQTDSHPHLGAWGDRLDRLKPGVRAIAVSPDLLRKGLVRGKRVRIHGLKGEFIVLD